MSLMIVIKNGDLKDSFVEASDNLWAPKASHEINSSILVIMKASFLMFGVYGPFKTCNSGLQSVAMTSMFV
jgi:hypothetical protein